jgi:mannose-6-phosphate isomerase-like protein (cupin superfamily)
MGEAGKNYEAASIGALKDVTRVTLHEILTLTGSEVSVNRMPAGASIPFIHSHKANEEVYIFLEGRGAFLVDGDQFDVAEGSVVRVDPAGKRSIKAADDEGLAYICIQAGCGTLAQYTMTDGVIHEEKADWK